MCKAIDDMIQDGRKLGRKEGRAAGRNEGISIGEDRMAALIQRMLTENRMQDVKKILENKSYRHRLYKQYGI